MEIIYFLDTNSCVLQDSRSFGIATYIRPQRQCQPEGTALFRHSSLGLSKFSFAVGLSGCRSVICNR
jgi:hypothetical protein